MSSSSSSPSSSDDEEDFIDSDGDEWTEYFNWEEDFFISNRFLTDWSITQVHKPGQIPLTSAGIEKIPRSNSIIGPSWERMKAARILMTKDDGSFQEEIENERVSYEQLYKLSVQNVKMLAAWKKRKKKTKVSWDIEKLEDLLTNLREDHDIPAIFHTSVIQEPEFVDTNQYGYIVPEMMTPTERVKYSVGKLMQMLGTNAQLDELSSELIQVKNWLFSQMMKSLNSCLPVSLPYPAMTSLFKALYDVNNSVEENSTPQLGMMDSSDAIKLVEEKYLVRLYLSMADIYNVLREIMFRHPALTRPTDFSQTFQFMRSTMMLNLNSMKMLPLSQAEENQASSSFGPKTCFYVENDLRFENESIESNTSATSVSLCNGYIVTITDGLWSQGDGLYNIHIFNTETREVQRDFPVDIKSCSSKCKECKIGEISFKCSSMVDDLLLLSSGCPRLLLINWKKGKIQENIKVKKRTVNFLSKHGEKVWIVQLDPKGFFTRHSLKVFEAGKKGSQLDFGWDSKPEFGWSTKPTVISVKENWLVISTNVKCDEKNMKSVQWINLHTYQLISEDLYPSEKMPRITIDSSHRDCNEESLKCVQMNDLGTVEIWKIERCGKKQLLRLFEAGQDDNQIISYSHPYLLMTSKHKFIREDFEVINAHKVSLYELNEEMDERQVIFFSNCSVKMRGFYMFQFPRGKMSINLYNGVLVMMTETKTKQRVDSFEKLRVKWSRFDFGKAGLGVLLEDIKIAEEVLEKIQKERLNIHQSTETLGEHVRITCRRVTSPRWSELDIKDVLLDSDERILSDLVE